jgi:hypothetical protein
LVQLAQLERGEPDQGQHHEMIQKRTTTVDSCQPFCSKWWCSGAMRKTRLPVSLKDVTWMITDMVFEHEQAADDGESTISCLVATGDGAKRAAQAPANPLSPMKIMAGGALNHRKPSPAPISARR